jgi:hypothetical protein
MKYFRSAGNNKKCVVIEGYGGYTKSFAEVKIN